MSEMILISASPHLCFKIADHLFQFFVPDPKLGHMIRYLLRHHVVSGTYRADINPSVVVKLIYGDCGKEQKTMCLQEPSPHSKHWTWRVPNTVGQWLLEQFYYLVLFPVLSRIFASLQIIRLHGALVFDNSTGVILILGDRGDGKSSVAASWLNNNGLISTDDVVLLREFREELHSYGIHREFHIDPKLVDYLTGLSGLTKANEYLQGSGRLLYDWKTFFPEQCAASLSAPKHIVLSKVYSNRSTSVKRLTTEELNTFVERSLIREEDNHLLPSAVLDRVKYTLQSACGWAITWGVDIWGYEGQHLGFMQRKFATRFKKNVSSNW